MEAAIARFPRRQPQKAPRRDAAWPAATVKEEGAKLPPLSVVEGTVERIVPGGLGLLRDDEGVILARGGLVGERVRVEVTARRGGVRQGSVVFVASPSPERVTPDCGLHPRCGGCDLLDLSEDAQSDAKQSIVLDALKRTGHLDDAALARVEPLRRAPLFAGARRRARLSVDDAGRPAFFARQSHELVALERCPALSPALDAALADLAEADFLVPGAQLSLACDDDERVSLAVSGAVSRRDAERVAGRAVEAGIATGAVVLTGRGSAWARFSAPVLEGEVAPGCEGGPYRSDAATFTQATRFGAEAITAEVLAGARGAARVLELFAGAGHLSLPLAASGARVVAVEGDPQAFHWLVTNLEGSGLQARLEAHQARVGEHTLDALTLEAGPFDVLVADPPRTGVPGLPSLLELVSAERVVLVSCDVATGARDLRLALAAGYALERLVPIDAFPRTSHVEWVATLSRIL
jgi:23S rRNA (uracil1939-C5)-methyltransferase